VPDRRQHRGPHPDDEHTFAESQLVALRTAVADYSWLLTRGYGEPSALKLVGDRYNLTARQRSAVRRSACSDAALEARAARQVGVVQCDGLPLGIDGYNVLITTESALSGGVILVGRDGCLRDLASLHGTYRRVEETVPALRLLINAVKRCGAAKVDFYLDRPVSNSGRLRVMIQSILEEGHASGDWRVCLVDRPDAALADYPGPVATSDSVILDRCAAWVNLTATIIHTHVPGAWKIDLG